MLSLKSISIDGPDGTTIEAHTHTFHDGRKVLITTVLQRKENDECISLFHDKSNVRDLANNDASFKLAENVYASLYNWRYNRDVISLMPETIGATHWGRLVELHSMLTRLIHGSI
jgi:hypothetical protein